LRQINVFQRRDYGGVIGALGQRRHGMLAVGPQPNRFSGISTDADAIELFGGYNLRQFNVSL